MKKDYEKYILKTRKPNYPIHPAILNRHSPRVLQESEVTEEELLTILEAARWAPSSSNTQPWRFIVAKKGSADYVKMRQIMDKFNQNWTVNATYLMVLISYHLNDQGGFERTHSFVTGGAWENLAIQANDMDLVAHAMAGFDYEKAKEVLGIPDDYTVECMIAVGRRTPLDEVPKKYLEGETPNTRKKLDEIIFDGQFGKKFKI